MTSNATIVPFLLLLFYACGPAPATTMESGSPEGFRFSVADDGTAAELLKTGAISCNDCTVGIDTVAGRPGLRMATTAEFSDLRIDLPATVGRTIDFGAGGYLYFDVFLPEGGAVMSVKFNMGSGENFGGCGNYFNNLRDWRGRWCRVEVPLAEQYDQCHNWVGEGDFLRQTNVLTINPYNADRVDAALLYINNLRLSPERLEGEYVTPRLSERPYVADNQPYTITFDRPELLARQQAYRTFEATTQTIRSGKFGNPTNAIRAYGTGQNNYICYLPDIEEMTGHPVNFYEVDSLYFDYYLTPESDSVQGARLFITTGEDWEGMLIVENFMAAEDFERGSWNRFAVALSDQAFTRARAPLDVLAEVYEMRLDLKYDKSAGPIEIWFDNFGWK